jgi:hypothetical protein
LILLFLFYYLPANKLGFSFQLRKELFNNLTVVVQRIWHNLGFPYSLPVRLSVKDRAVAVEADGAAITVHNSIQYRTSKSKPRFFPLYQYYNLFYKIHQIQKQNTVHSKLSHSRGRKNQLSENEMIKNHMKNL